FEIRRGLAVNSGECASGVRGAIEGVARCTGWGTGGALRHHHGTAVGIGRSLVVLCQHWSAPRQAKDRDKNDHSSGIQLAGPSHVGTVSDLKAKCAMTCLSAKKAANSEK